MRIPAALGGLLLALAIAALCGCGSSGDTGATRTVVTVIKQAPASTTGTPSSGDADAKDDSAANEDADDLVDDDGGGEASGGKITVPNEVGKNHQAAQDDMQAHGLYNLSEKDATGQGRMLILDRNWKVVSQSPAPGTKVADDATITLRSKKYTDP